LDRDFNPKYPGPDYAPNLRRGDILLTYAYLGEFDSVVWFDGKYYPRFSIRFTTWPDGTGCVRGDECAGTYVDLGRKEWWAKVKPKSGRTAWVQMDNGGFAGVDALGDR
jgi:hypothetical protein